MDKFAPVAFDPKAHAAKQRDSNPAFREAYDSLDDEFAALAVLLKARKDAGLTQAEVASKMGVSQPYLLASNQALAAENTPRPSQHCANTPAPAENGWSFRCSNQSNTAA